MTHYYLDVLHAAGVGTYSTGYQWGLIVGATGAVQSGTTIPGPSNLNGLPSWLAGQTTLEGAQANCAQPPVDGRAGHGHPVPGGRPGPQLRLPVGPAGQTRFGSE